MATNTRLRALARRRRQLFRTFGVSLAARILAVNIVTLALMAASLLYLESYRNQRLAERFKRIRAQTEMLADALPYVPRAQTDALLTKVGRQQGIRLRVYDAGGRLLSDSFAPGHGPAPFALVDPARDPWLLRAARLLDRGMDAILGSPDVPDYAAPTLDTAARWPEIARARVHHSPALTMRYAPDRTPVLTAAVPLGTGPQARTLLALTNDRDITQSVRDARQTLALVVLMALLITVFLSLYLARTIVQPLRVLARAAVRVRLGRDRAVVVPRLPERGDEIGLLARALSDMSGALRQRMDAVETFAADVAHEIKNPLASLRSALESLDKVEEADLRRQLTDIALHDVRRIDRLVTEIAEASRIDAELSRTTFEPVDMMAMAQGLAGERERRGANGQARLAITLLSEERPVVPGDPARLERVFQNLLDNAVSFSPAGGLVEVVMAQEEGSVVIEVSDEGPGIPARLRGRVFDRFHSSRPEREGFGAHSGLGLAIARTIIEAHDGTLEAREPLPGRPEGRQGARLVMVLPAYVAQDVAQ